MKDTCPCSTAMSVDFFDDMFFDDISDPTYYGPHSSELTHIVVQRSIGARYNLFYACSNHARFYEKCFEVHKLPENRKMTGG